MNLYFANIHQVIWHILAHPQKWYHRVRNKVCTFRIFWGHLFIFPSCRGESISQPAKIAKILLIIQDTNNKGLQLVWFMNARKCLIETRPLAAAIKLYKSRYTLETVWTPTMGTGGKEIVGVYMCCESILCCCWGRK